MIRHANKNLRPPGRARSREGFTLFEMVVVMAVAGMIGGVVVTVIQRPMQAYQSTVIRTRMVDDAEAALRRMARDVRRALPNSVRVDANGDAVELLHTAFGGRFRQMPHPDLPTIGPDSAEFDFPNGTLTRPDNMFNMLGLLSPAATTPGGGLVDLETATGTRFARLAIYSTAPNQTYADAVRVDDGGVITADDNPINVIQRVNNNAVEPNEDQFQLTREHDFGPFGQQHRIYMVDTPVTYSCAIPGQFNVLSREWDYNIMQNQLPDPVSGGGDPLGTSAPLLTSLVGTGLGSGCDFEYNQGSLQRGGLLRVRLDLAGPAATNERIFLLHELHVINAP